MTLRTTAATDPMSLPTALNLNADQVSSSVVLGSVQTQHTSVMETTTARITLMRPTAIFMCVCPVSLNAPIPVAVFPEYSAVTAKTTAEKERMKKTARR